MKISQLLEEQSLGFAVGIVQLIEVLEHEGHPNELMENLLKHGTGIGLLIRNCELGLGLMQDQKSLNKIRREISRTLYWLDLIYVASFLDEKTYTELRDEAMDMDKTLRDYLDYVQEISAN